MKKRCNLITRFFLMLLWIYKRCLSPLKPACCRFKPTCSAYARTALREYGLLKGGWLTFKRLLRCHPLYKGDVYDPVPEEPLVRNHYRR